MNCPSWSTVEAPPVLGEPANEARPSSTRAGGIGHRSLFAVFALSLAAAFAGGVLIYFKFVAYGRVAARHLPDDTLLAARIDVETMLISGPIAPGCDDFESVSGAVQLDTGMEGDLAIRLRPERPADPKAIARAFAALAAAAPAESKAQRPLDQAEISVRRPDEAAAKLAWTGPELDAGAAWLGALLRAQFARLPSEP